MKKKIMRASSARKSPVKPRATASTAGRRERRDRPRFFYTVSIENPDMYATPRVTSFDVAALSERQARMLVKQMYPGQAVIDCRALNYSHAWVSR
jgi:hypothetical protein